MHVAGKFGQLDVVCGGKEGGRELLVQRLSVQFVHYKKHFVCFAWRV